jgi:multiple sugar transport system permease protein
MYLAIGDFFGNRALLYDSILGVVLIHAAFQLGFATFVLSSYLKTIPKEISESAMVDGASVWVHYTQIILPIAAPTFSCIGCINVHDGSITTSSWALVLMKSDSKRPITSALARLQGEFVTDFNLLAAGCNSCCTANTFGFRSYHRVSSLFQV